MSHLQTFEELNKCLQEPWARSQYQDELNMLQGTSDQGLSPTIGQWTSIAIRAPTDGADEAVENAADRRNVKPEPFSEDQDDNLTLKVRTYLKNLARSRIQAQKGGSGDAYSKDKLQHCLEGSLKLSQHIKFPKQNIAGIRSVSALGEVYGLSIMEQSTSKPPSDMSIEKASSIIQSKESKQIESACSGHWGAEACLDPSLTDTSLLVTKLKALQVPPLPPKLGGERTLVIPRLNASSRQDTAAPSREWKSRIDTLLASSKISKDTGHTAPIVRLVVPQDQRFFVTASHDGTCRIWELDKVERSNGLLESNFSYSGHTTREDGTVPRINDLAIVEGSHSVVSGASDGSLHVWRVDMVSGSAQPSASDTRNASRVAGSSLVRQTNPTEGEILAVNQFNTSSASILTFATQKGFIHSWDLRCAREPFHLKIPQDIGYTTSLTMGNDRNWAVTGTSRGFISLWDLRYQKTLKLWHHSRKAPVKRLATSFTAPPQSWSGKSGVARPFLFAACGPNECAMFDVESGSCRECFRTVDYGGSFFNNNLEDLPKLQQVPVSNATRRREFMAQGVGSLLGDVVSTSVRSINSMVGSIGASSQSFLITGGSDCRIRFWDFSMPSKCYVSSGLDAWQSRPTFERIDYKQDCRLMLCRQPPVSADHSKSTRKLHQGLRKPDASHEDSIQDLKVVRAGLLSCSRDSTVKLWR